MVVRTATLAEGGWICPVPLQNYPTIVLGHGSGGKMMADLIHHLFLPLLGGDALRQMSDSAVLNMDDFDPDCRLAFTTDSFVVRPLIFPGGTIGDLAVNGTINDLAMSGARPLWLSSGFILEEGLPLDLLGQIAASLATASRQAGVEIVTGDTKVVERGHGDGLYINTAGIGVIPPGVGPAPDRARPGDILLISGTVGDHGMAVLSVREGLGFDAAIRSDTAPLHGLVEMMLAAAPGGVRCLRDITRGGLAAVLNELAVASHVGMEFEEQRVPVTPAVEAACEMLGLDPLFIACEGKLVAIVDPGRAGAVLAAMQAHPLGRAAARIGLVTADHSGRVVARTRIGGLRIVDLPAGELLPRIC